MSLEPKPSTRPGFIVYRGGLQEEIELLAVATGWRIASVPLGSEAVAFGDYATVRELADGRLQVVSIREGGWRTLRSRSIIPPNEQLVVTIASHGWLAAWNKDGYLSIGVPAEVYADARRMLDKWEANAFVERWERGA